MNTRGIPAQSEPENLEKEYSYTVNEMTGEKVPFGEEPKHGPTEPPTPSGDPRRVEADNAEAQAKAERAQKEEQQSTRSSKREKSSE